MGNRTEHWNLNRLTRIEWERLKSNGGMMMHEVPAEMIGIYKRVQTGEKKPYYRDGIEFACLCMRCMWDRNVTQKKSFPELLGDIYHDAKTGKAVKNRMLEMFDESWGEDGQLLRHLYNLARIMRNKNGSIVPDFEELSEMIAAWDTRGVKRRWLNNIIE